MKRILLTFLTLLISGCATHIKAPAPVTAPTVGFGGSDAGFGGTAQPSDKLGARLTLSYPACVPGNGVQCTTPYGLWLPPHGYPAWDVPMNANTLIINAALGAGGGKPAAPSFYLQGANNGATAFTTDSSTTPFLSQQITTSVNTTLNVAAPPFNAISDALSDSNCTMASGSTTLNCAGGLFTAAAVGKTISVQYAGGTAGGNQPLVTTIATYVSPTQVTLAAPATQYAGGVISGFSVTNIGTSGYVNRHDVATTTSGSGVGALINVAASNGVLNGNTVLFGRGTTASGYTTASGLATTSICNGAAGPTAAIASITAVAGAVTAMSFTGVGQTYPLGCQIYPTQGDGTAYAVVSSVISNVDNGGVGYAVNDTISPIQSGSSNDAALTVTSITGAGAIWGTDDSAAFNAWAAALGPGKPGLIPNGQFIYNVKGGAQTMVLHSNTSITMNRSGTLYIIGYAFNSAPGGIAFSPAGGSNYQFDGLNVSGEFINTRNYLGIAGYGSYVIQSSLAGIKNVQVINSIFSNLPVTIIADGNNADSNYDFSHNLVQNSYFIEPVNLNTLNTTVSYNTFTNTGGIEDAGAQSHYNYNKFNNNNSLYIIQVGGNTAGVPYTGSEVVGNIITNPSPGSSCISVGDAFSYGLIADNICTGVSQSALGNGFGINNVYSGYVHNNNNTIISNTITGYGSNVGVYLQGVTGTIVRNNSTVGVGYGLTLSNAQNVDSSGNHWSSVLGAEVSLGGGSTASVKDNLTTGNYSLSGGSTLNLDSHLYTPAGDLFVSPPVYLVTPTFTGNWFTTRGSGNNNATNTPAVSGNTGYNLLSLNVGASNAASNSCLDFGGVNSGTSNASHSWMCAEYQGEYSSDLALFVASINNTTFLPYQSLRGLTMYANDAGTPNSYVKSFFNGSLCVGTACNDPGSGNLFINGLLKNSNGTLIPSTALGNVGNAAGYVELALTGTTGTIVGTSLSGTCDSGTASVTGAIVGHPVAVSSTTGADVGGAFDLRGSVTSTGTVTVYVCGTGTPASLAYNVVVF
jgi:hypothetical protein